MKNISAKKLAIIGFFFISIIGTLSHFVYNWTGENGIVGAFFAVNESSWEHLKIAIIPAFVWLIVEFFILDNKNNFCIAKITSFITIMLSILILFYGYKFILGKDMLILDILIFYVAIGLGQFVSYKLINVKQLPNILNYISFELLILLFASFIIFTYFTPELEIFKDPRTNKYGIITTK